MALTFLNTSMIERPTVFSQLSVTELQLENITGNTNIFGDLTIYGELTALSGFNIVEATITTTSALSISNVQASPALDVFQGGGSPTIAIFKNQIGDIVSINNLGITVNGILSSSTTGSSLLWNQAYTLVQSSSSDWNYQGTDLKDLSGNWEAAYQAISANDLIRSNSTFETPTTGISAINNIVYLSQETYNSLAVILPSTLYVIV